MAGERLGSAVAVRSAALSRGRVSFGGPKPGFESVKLVNLNNSSSFSPRVNNRIEAAPSFQFEPLRPRHLNSLRARLGQIQSGPEIKIQPEVSIKLQAADVQNASRIDLMKLAAQSRLMTGRVRMLRSQSMPMAGAARTEAVAAIQGSSAPALESGDSRPINMAGDFKAEIKRNVNQTKTRRVIRELRKEATEQEKRRKRFVERDLMMNVLRLKTLVKGYEELRAENPEGGVDGMVLARKSSIGTSRELRSLLLDQRGYKDRQDGSQRRMELFLGSVRAVNKEQLKEIVNGNTAVKETYEKPRVLASHEEVNNVVNRPEDLNARVEEVEIEEVVGQTRSERVVPVESIKTGEPQVLEERKTEFSNEDVKEGSAVGVENTSRSIEMFGDSMASVFGDLYPRLQRRELVF